MVFPRRVDFQIGGGIAPNREPGPTSVAVKPPLLLNPGPAFVQMDILAPVCATQFRGLRPRAFVLAPESKLVAIAAPAHGAGNQQGQVAASFRLFMTSPQRRGARGEMQKNKRCDPWRDLFSATRISFLQIICRAGQSERSPIFGQFQAL
jgi:hypothetical protein